MKNAPELAVVKDMDYYFALESKASHELPQVKWERVPKISNSLTPAPTVRLDNSIGCKTPDILAAAVHK